MRQDKLSALMLLFLLVRLFSQQKTTDALYLSRSFVTGMKKASYQAGQRLHVITLLIINQIIIGWLMEPNQTEDKLICERFYLGQVVMHDLCFEGKAHERRQDT